MELLLGKLKHQPRVLTVAASLQFRCIGLREKSTGQSDNSIFITSSMRFIYYDVYSCKFPQKQFYRILRSTLNGQFQGEHYVNQC